MRRGKAVTIAGAIMASVVVLGALTLWMGSRLVVSTLFRLAEDGAERKWSLAGRLARLGPAGSKEAEEWYLSRLDAGPSDKARAEKELVVVASGNALKILLERFRTHSGDEARDLIRRIAANHPDMAVSVLRSLLLDRGTSTENLPLAVVAEGVGEASHAVFAEALQASDKAVRLRTIECITANVSITRPLLPHLQAALDDAEPQVRLTAAGALHYLGEDAAPALPVLLRLTRDMDEGVRYSALSTAVRTGVQSEALISALKQALYEADVEMRCLACSALGNLQVNAPEIQERILVLLGDHSREVQRAALRYWQMAGPEGNLAASQEVKKMVERFSSAKETEPDHVIGPEDIHNAALSALFTLDRTEAERVFSAELASSNDGVRRNAVLLMGDTQFKPSSIVSRVLRAMEDSNEKVRHAALRVIELRHLTGAKVQAALKSASEDPVGNIGSYARHLYVERGGAEGQ